MTKVIIGVHGLANKPEESCLTEWWDCSIKEGLAKNCGINNPDYEFTMVYWAKYLYKHPMHREPHFSFDKLYNDEPYKEAEGGAIKMYKDGFMDSARAKLSDMIDGPLDHLQQRFGTMSTTDWLLRNKLRDLHFYWDVDRVLQDDKGTISCAKDVLQGRLVKAVKQHIDHGDDIMLISHSMGTIISYDVLRDMGLNKGNAISHFITMGSPIGLPIVKSKIKIERHDNAVRTPTMVRKSWVNLADKRDPVALDTHLAGDFGPNAHGVEVRDDLVSNDYPDNAHKSYGYLRTPELSELVKSFLNN